MPGQSTNGGASDSSERQYYPQPPFVICPLPAAPVYHLPPPEQTGCVRYSIAFEGPSAAGAVEPAADNTSAATQLPSSSNEATATNTAAAAGTVTANAPPKRLSVMHQKIWDLKQKQDAKDPEAAARSRAARIQRRKEQAIWDAEIKAEQEKFEASKAAATDNANTDATDAAASQSSTETRALPAWYYDEREWNKKWWETHPDRCT
ncbi:hypothetical protein BJ166DRAFT_490899 [Pestalotiopsis sp. NC0098]|nr:hypothetical protein BJ166DRAFT_490899 [Pestalotiopsis sp. NC0098]